MGSNRDKWDVQSHEKTDKNPQEVQISSVPQLLEANTAPWDETDYSKHYIKTR